MSIQKSIKLLFPDELITHHLNDLNNYLIQQNDNKNRVFLSIEKDNKLRLFCSLSIEQLNILYKYCPITQRTLYESIPPASLVKAYVDFEYYVNNNDDLEDHNIAPRCCLKILYHVLHLVNHQMYLIENNDENILKQFLVLQA
jgi:hypothetical protein